MKKLEGLKIATALDINMVYYTIRLDAKSKDRTTILMEFGKFQYSFLSIGMGISGDIFQTKVKKLLGDIERVKAYIENIIVLDKGKFADHVGQLRFYFSRIRKSGLKIRSKKCIFILKEIPYLGYVITREGVKHNHKKIQGIVYLQRPKTTTK